jgi:DNA adenine methylase
LIEELLAINSMKNAVYAEPYAGGAGAAINLLLSNKVEAIKINDASIAIYSFWHFLISESEKFIKLIVSTEVTLEEWQRQRTIFKTSLVPNFELGFATFFLSRTNRSGILNAGPIGGQDRTLQDTANYKLDCRFNKKVLIDKIRKITERRENIFVTNHDALQFLKNISDSNTLVYLDPPYYKQGKALYLNYYKHKDHVELSSYLKETSNFKWLLSYDNVHQIRELYSDFNLYKFNLYYTAHDVKKGCELLTHSKDLFLPKQLSIKRSDKNIRINPISTLESGMVLSNL